MIDVARRTAAHRVARFAVVSGTGLAIDYAVLTVLCELGLPAGWANVVSAATAVSFVFVVSARHVFESPRGFLLVPFLWYAGYQAIAVGTASLLVGALTAAFDGRYLIAKTLVVPLSFSANYLFMSWLFARQLAREER